jgi:hypothetical protein
MADPTEPPDWGALGETWRASPGPDLGILRRAVERKRRLMVALVSLEIALTVATSVFLVRAALRAAGPSRAWALSLLGFIWLFQALLLYLRRGRWRYPAGTGADLLQLTARRARTGIALVWVNLAGLAAVGLLAGPRVIRAWPERAGAPGATARMVVGGAVVLATIGFSVWFVRRQRRILAQVKDLQAQLESAGPDPGPG